MKKKAQIFDNLSAAMVGLGAFFIVVVVIVLIISTTKTTSIVCAAPGFGVDGTCLQCTTGYTWNGTTPGNVCCNSTLFSAGTSIGTNCTGINQTLTFEFDSAAYNGTKDIQEAVAIAPQFSPVVAVAVIGFALIALFGGVAIARSRR